MSYESKFSFVSRIEFIRSKLSKLSDHVPGDRAFHPRWAAGVPCPADATPLSPLVTGAQRSGWTAGGGTDSTGRG